jgi:hypothetical protein
MGVGGTLPYESRQTPTVESRSEGRAVRRSNTSLIARAPWRRSVPSDADVRRLVTMSLRYTPSRLGSVCLLVNDPAIEDGIMRPSIDLARP